MKVKKKTYYGKLHYLKLSLCTLWNNMAEMKMWLQAFLNFPLCGAEWSVTRLDRFNPKERALLTIFFFYYLK